MYELIPFARRANGCEYHPFRELENFQKGFFGTSNAFSFNNGEALLRTDVEETENAWVLEADLPGVAKEAIDLQIEDDILTIRAERKAERKEEDAEKNYVRIERSRGVYSRSFDVSEVDTEAIGAKFENGVLTVTLPKKAQQKPEAKKVAVEYKSAVSFRIL